MIKLSLIVPVYNCIGNLSACIDSILRQTNSDWELLLVDDGSSDGSGAVCDRFAEQDGRIRVFHKANGGASSARNLGLKYATGDYILFIDGDDTVEPDFLERISHSLSETSSHMVIFGMAFDSYSLDGHLEKTDLFSVKHTGLFSSQEILSSCSDFFADNALSSVCNKAFSKRILQDIGLRFSEQMTLYEDLDFVLRYLPYCEQTVCLDQALYHYHIQPHTPFESRREYHLEKLQHNLDLLMDSVLAVNVQDVSQMAADLCAQMYDLHLMNSSQPKKALPQIIASMQNSAALRALSQVGVSPSPSVSPSWPMILDGDASALFASLQKRKLVRKAKQIVKPALKKLGLYH